MPGPIIATARVEVTLDGPVLGKQAKDIARRAGKALEAELESAGRKAGAKLGEGIADGAANTLERDLDKVARNAGDRVGNKFEAAGRDVGNHFKKGLAGVGRQVGEDLASEVAAGAEKKFKPHLNFLAGRVTAMLSKDFKGAGSTAGAALAERFTAVTSNDIERGLRSVARSAGNVAEKEMNRVGHRAYKGLENEFKKFPNIWRLWFSGLRDSMRGKAGGALADTGKRMADKFNLGFRGGMLSGVDNTVKLVLGLIAAAGPEIAALGSALSASTVALFSSALVGLGGSLIALGGPLSAVLAAVLPIITTWKKIGSETASINQSLTKLNESWKALATTMLDQAAPALGRMFDKITGVLSTPKLGKALGDMVAGVTNAISKMFDSPGFKAFLEAMTTSFPKAVTSFAQGATSALSGFFRVMAAGAPLAERLGEAFASWGEGFASAMEKALSSGALTEFFDKAGESLHALTGVLGPLTKALGNVFMLGLDSGNRLLGTLGKLAQKFLDFTRSSIGKEKITGWFEQAEQIFDDLLHLIGELGKALGQMVTPQVMGQLHEFLRSLADLAPALGGLLSAIGKIGILDLLAKALNAVGDALMPVLPSLERLGEALGVGLGKLIEGSAPLLNALASAIGAVADALAPLLGPLGDVLGKMLGGIGKFVQATLPGFQKLLDVMTPFVQKLLEAAASNADKYYEGLIPIAEDLSRAFADMAEQLGPLLDVLLPALIKAMPLLITGMVAFLEMLTAPLRAAHDMYVQAKEIVDWIHHAADAIEDFGGRVGTALSGIGNAFSGIGQWFQEHSPDEFFDKFDLTGAGENVAATFAAGLGTLPGKIAGFIPNVVSALGNMVNQAISALSPFPSRAAAAGDPGPAILARIRDMASRALVAVGTWVSNMVARIRELPGRAAGALASFGSSIVSRISAGFAMARIAVGIGIATVASMFRGLASRITGALAGVPAAVFGFGASIGRSLARGIRSTIGAAVDEARSLASQVVSGIRGILHLGSPSKVLMRVGHDVVAGLSLGIARSSGLAVGQMNRLAARLVFDPAANVNRPAGGNNVLRQTNAATVPTVGRAGAGRTVIVQPGALQITTPNTNAHLVGMQVLDRMAVVLR